MINTTVGEHYLIERELGRDQFGTVYVGRDIRWKQEDMLVAVRVLDTKLTQIQGFAERFADVAPRLVSWNQRYINRQLAQGSVRDAQSGLLQYFLVSELPGSETLFSYLQRVPNPLPMEQIGIIIEQIAAAIEYAHRNNVYHCNLNLWNITVRDIGTEVITETTDFGLVQMVMPYSQAEQERLTGWKMPPGVPEFIAPERFRGEPPAKSNDVYVMGVLLYYILSGRAPFAGTYDQLILAHSYQQPPSLGPLVRHGPELLQMLLRPLSKAPLDRISVQDVCIRYRQITGLSRYMLPIFDTHPPLPTPPPSETDTQKKKGGWFGLR